MDTSQQWASFLCSLDKSNVFLWDMPVSCRCFSALDLDFFQPVQKLDMGAPVFIRFLFFGDFSPFLQQYQEATYTSFKDLKIIETKYGVKSDAKDK